MRKGNTGKRRGPLDGKAEDLMALILVAHYTCMHVINIFVLSLFCLIRWADPVTTRHVMRREKGKKKKVNRTRVSILCILILLLICSLFFSYIHELNPLKILKSNKKYANYISLNSIFHKNPNMRSNFAKNHIF